ncbi:MAG: hypothetical protein KBD78_06965 [Oligoflexales bacterium]|nr:hypothetical protein [Oligoflexales bacterium]
MKIRLCQGHSSYGKESRQFLHWQSPVILEEKMTRKKTYYKFCILAFFALHPLFSACQFFDVFKSKNPPQGQTSGLSLGSVIGQDLGEKAGGPDADALEALYLISSSHAPSAVRPDPDTYIRLLLNEYREPGATTARQIAEVEAYRPFLGGATEDFQKPAQTNYDSTALLSYFKVAEIICTGLVAPNEWQHSGWTSVLPNQADQVEQNIEFLAQRFLGIPSNKIDAEYLTQLAEIYQNSRLAQSEDETTEETEPAHSNAHYIPVCTALALHAEALFH